MVSRGSVVEHRWTLIECPDIEIARQLSQEINVSETIARILVSRGIDSFEKAKTYFRPNLSQLHDPFLMHGMEKAVGRILDALKNKEKILVYGDYDVDGTSGAAMLYMFLQELAHLSGGNGTHIAFYIPERQTEGYGISRTGIERAHENGVSLLISIDCGITAVEQTEYAKGLGIDVIICDHHEPSETIPGAFAVLDPIQPECGYPFKFLSGCGVGFKLTQGISQRLGKDELPYKYLEYVAIASIADIVPLVGENRVLASFGLELINKNPSAGVNALIKNAGLKRGQVTTGQVVFILAPRINAVGRLGDAKRAVELLICDDEVAALELARVLEEENRNRRKIDEETFLHAQELVENYLDMDNELAIILHEENWHPGVIGIVASRLVEKYYRPTIMMTTVDGVAKGSARSIVGFDIYQALKRCEDKLLQFGGHRYAAGLSIELDKLDEFRDAFNAVAKELLTNELLTPEIRIDAEIALTDLSPQFMRILKQFAPFGPQNMKPVFLVHNVEVVGTPRIVGNNHLKMKVRQNGVVFDAIGFDLGHLKERVESGRRALDIVFSVEENDWNGNTFPQLRIRDLRPTT
jgi:single-stranded-DNA-specific exonuclease